MFDGIEFEHALDRSDHPALLVLIKHKIADGGVEVHTRSKNGDYYDRPSMAVVTEVGRT